MRVNEIAAPRREGLAWSTSLAEVQPKAEAVSAREGFRCCRLCNPEGPLSVSAKLLLCTPIEEGVYAGSGMPQPDSADSCVHGSGCSFCFVVSRWLCSARD